MKVSMKEQKKVNYINPGEKIELPDPCSIKNFKPVQYAFVFKGAVTLNGSILDWNWDAQTWATSPSKAMSNLKHRYRTEHGLESNAKIRLEGDLHAIYTKSYVDSEERKNEQLSFDF